MNSYRPHWDPVPAGYRWFTLDLSHTAASGVDARAMASRMGDRLAHLQVRHAFTERRRGDGR